MNSETKMALRQLETAVYDMDIAQVCIDTMNRFSRSTVSKRVIQSITAARQEAYLRYEAARKVLEAGD